MRLVRCLLVQLAMGSNGYEQGFVFGNNNIVRPPVASKADRSMACPLPGEGMIVQNMVVGVASK